MKKILIAIVLSIVSLMALAQTPLSEKESQEVLALLTQTAADMQTMQCRFVQEKTSAMLTEPSISEGIMRYAAPDKMRWEYTTPYAFALVVNGDRIVKVTDSQAEVLEGKSNRMYQGMVGFIMGSATGKNLFDASIFDVILYDDEAYWKAKMTPKRRDMKRLFSQMVFRFDKKTNGISCVEFVEAGGDSSSIRFVDIRINETSDPTVFAE